MLRRIDEHAAPQSVSVRIGVLSADRSIEMPGVAAVIRDRMSSTATFSDHHGKAARSSGFAGSVDRPRERRRYCD